MTSTSRPGATRGAVRRALALSAAASSVALALAGCATGATIGGAAEEPQHFPTGQTIHVWLLQPGASQVAADAYLVKTFEQDFPGNKLVIESKQWNTYIDDYMAAMKDHKGEMPDVVEMGNTNTASFTAAGVLKDLTSSYQALGGDDLLPGFVDAGTYGGKFYAPPYYSAGRVVIGASAKVGSVVPASLDEFVADAAKLKKDGYSGFYLPGKDWYNVLPFVWENGGFIAQQDTDGSWKAGFSTTGGIEGLTEFQKAFSTANSTKVAPADSDEADVVQAFCAGKVGYFSGATSRVADIDAPADGSATAGCPDTYGKDLVTFALPGKQKGTVARTFAGGSNLGVAAGSKNPDLAVEALKIMTSSGYQDLLALQGLIPARISSAASLPQDPLTLQAATAAQHAVLTPASPKWSDVENKQYLRNAFAQIAAGADVTKTAKKLDQEIEATLNG